MNPQAMITQMLMQQLQTKNPQAFQLINQARNSGTDPQQFLKQIIGNSSPQDMQRVLQMGKQMGVPDDVLTQIQNMR